ncbi:hypothetical protein AH70_07355 [Pediococcus damnosus LMG 28219]|nr:hypothetical protein AH70_07355 [Pediococcus damnosus LMG 28219]PIO81638.1 AP2 domain-containing protein [Pediococcus damnosus]PJE48842.1 AP2 domain-containing protein [Pediococcus damnosus]
MTDMYDLTGQRFGRLLVIKRSTKKVKNRNAQWKCLCDCGNHVIVDGYNLRNGTSRSCGCLRRDLAKLNSQKNCFFEKSKGNPNNFTSPSGVNYASIRKGKKNHSGVIGVSYDQQQQVWFARLMFRGKYVLLKSFVKFDDAVEAREEAEREYFHK